MTTERGRKFNLFHRSMEHRLRIGVALTPTAIESLTKEVSTCRQIPKPKPSGRSEFEMIIWLPEAALPFFKGLDYYSRGDYALAVPWFRHSYEKPGIPALGIVRCFSIHIGTVSTILPALILLIFGRVKLDTARPHKSY